jgi:hypothetical protein
MIWSKYNRVILVVGAITFLVVLFLIKNTTVFQNKGQAGLTYDNETLADLVNQDTDKDGIPDWEEGLWGTDPTKKETTPGTPDGVAIEKLKIKEGTQTSLRTNTGGQEVENLTKTDQFSRELFSTVTTLSQNGQLDQATIDKISNSLADHIQNSLPRKVFSLADIKTAKSDTVLDIQKYSDTISNLYEQNSVKYTVLDVLQKFTGDGENVDVSALPMLNPIIDHTNKVIAGMLATGVPQSLVTIHLEVMNEFQKLVENLNDIKLYDTDAVVALGAISTYQINSNALESSLNNLFNLITKKLNS